MELVDYLRVLRSYWIGVVLIVIAAVTAAGLYTLSQPKIYAADAGGFVTNGVSNEPALASLNDSLAKSRAASYVDIAKSRAVADLVIADLGLETSAAGLVGRISVEQPVDTVSITITARAGSPTEARELADAWVVALSERVAELENPDNVSGAVLGVEPVEAAALPSSPVSPRPEVNVAAALALGLLLGLGYALVRSYFDRRLRSPEDVQQRFDTAIVGRIPMMPGAGEQPIRLAVAGGADRWAEAEAFRKLRTNLSFMDVDNPPRVVVVTSPRPSDGKTTVAVNLAAAIAYSGQPVTLVDGDLRRPSVADSLGLIEGAGITDVLVGKVSLDEMLQDYMEVPGLSVLAAGGAPPNPSELLGSRAMGDLLAELATRGMVVVDGPPLLPVTDSAVLTRQADGALVVVAANKTLDHELSESLTSLEAVNGRTLGVVLNRAKSKAAAYRDADARSRYDSRTPEPSTAQASHGKRRKTSTQS